MNILKKKTEKMSVAQENSEYIANTYVMRCFSVMMFVYLFIFLLNVVGVFVVEQDLMWKAFVSSVVMYFVVQFVSRKMSFSDPKTKYFILAGTIVVFTITGVYLTYHVVLISLLPFLYATLYSSKSTMRFVYGLTVFSTIIVVYGGYYLGLCDANMVLLTSRDMSDYVTDGLFELIQVNSNPVVSLFLFFVVPRCLIAIAYMVVCNSIVKLSAEAGRKQSIYFCRQLLLSVML